MAFFTRFSSIRWLSVFNLLGLSVLSGFAVYLTQDQLSWRALFSAPTSAPADKIENPVEIITLVRALQIFHRPGTIFLDVRAKEVYDYGHIENAERFIFEKEFAVPGELLTHWQNASTVVVYCNGISCGAGFVIASELSKKGIKDVKYYGGGWPEWRSCSLPMAMSDRMKQDIAKGSL